MTEEMASRELTSVFLHETEEHLRAFEQTLADMERTGVVTDEQVNGLFRILHTVKGSAAMLREEALSRTAHILENLFAGLKSSGGVTDAALVRQLTGLLFDGLTYFRAALECLGGDRRAPDTPEALWTGVERLSAAIAGADAAEAPEEGTGADPAEELPPWAEEAVRIRLHVKEMPLPCMRVKVILRAFAPNCEKLCTLPAAPERHPELAERIMAEGILIVAVLKPEIAPEEAVGCLQRNAYVASARLELQSAEAAAEKAGASAAQNGQDRVISVRQAKLTEHMDLLGELSITQGMLEEEFTRLRVNAPEMSRLLAEVRKLTASLHKSAVSMNLVEMDSIFFRLRLIAREMAAKLNKDVELTCRGGNIEVDKNVLEKLYDPLMHLVRNGIDHGIEDPAARVRAGKPARGTLAIEAAIFDDAVQISLSDDGAGIDADAVLEKARSQGIARDGRTYTEREIHRMLLQPGFSTKQALSEYSGRGIGLDIVATGLSELGGSLSIESAKGVGTTFLLRIPASLSMLDALDFTIGGQRMAIPVSALRQILTGGQGDGVQARQGDAAYPCFDLAERLGLKSPMLPGEGMYLVLRGQERPFAVWVERIGDIRTIVHKPLPAALSDMARVTGVFSGCTILPSGGVCLLLDAERLQATKKGA